MVVAVGILAVMVSFAGVVFKSGIEANRAAAANAEIMQKLRAITEQLNSDFRGLRKEIPVKTDPIATNFDAIAFFADGDFQSTQFDGGAPVWGNVAAIFYGLVDPASYPTPPKPQEKILARRQVILTADSSLGAYDLNLPEQTLLEYYVGTLSQLKADPNLMSQMMLKLIGRPKLDNAVEPSGKDLTVYMAKGVDNFIIEYVEPGVLGFTATDIKWLPVGNREFWPPVAFKFTFTLYDSHGVIKVGRTFTHIVYLDN
jgi:hypothetical protein